MMRAWKSIIAIFSIVNITLVLTGCGGGGGGVSPTPNFSGQFVGLIAGSDITHAPVAGTFSMFVKSDRSVTLNVLDTTNNITVQLTGSVSGSSTTVQDVTGSVIFQGNFSTSRGITVSLGSWRNTLNGSFGSWSTQIPVVCPVLDATQSPLNFFTLTDQAITIQSLALSSISTPRGNYGYTTPDGLSFGVNVSTGFDNNGMPLRDIHGQLVSIVKLVKFGRGYICIAAWNGPSLSLGQTIPDL